MASHQDGATVSAGDEAPDRRNGGWTDERIEQLKKLWAGDTPSSQIAKTLGGVSKNAVIGKATRLGLPKRDSQTQAFNRERVRHPASHMATRRARAPQAPPVKAARAPANAAQKAAPAATHSWREGPSVEPTPVPETVVADIPGLRAVPMTELAACQCRWPLPGPAVAGCMDETLFCGAPAPLMGGDVSPYCPEHMEIAHPPSARAAKERSDRKLGVIGKGRARRFGR